MTHTKTDKNDSLVAPTKTTVVAAVSQGMGFARLR